MPAASSICLRVFISVVSPALLLSLSLAACGDRAQGAKAATIGEGGASDEPGTPQRPDVDPCAVLTKEEIAEQLLLTIAPEERSNWATNEFVVTPTEVDWGMSRRCEIAWQTRHQIGDGPQERGNFNVMVFPIEGLGFPADRRRAVSGAGPEIFKHERVYYVTKGRLAASLTDFKGTSATGDENAGRVALLRRIASRLP
jgi:hypothetical protein